MHRGLRMFIAKGGRGSLRPSYRRPNLTLISTTAKLRNFSFNQFHSHFLPNDFVFWQFSRILDIFRGSGKLPKCRVIWQKMAVEWIRLWGSLFRKNNFFFHGSTLKKFMVFVSQNTFLGRNFLNFSLCVGH